jgi:hypothetical protein
LSFQKRKAGFNFRVLRISVSRWPTLDDIANVYLCPVKLDCGYNAAEKLTGRADKRFTLSIFFKSGALPDKYKFGSGVTTSKNDMFAPLRKPTTLTISYICTNILQGFGRIDPGLIPGSQYLKGLFGTIKTFTTIG